MAGIAQTYVGGVGSVRFGSSKSRGLRNKRRAHWARERRIEDIEKEKRAKAQAAKFEDDQSWD